ncbi:hypothetical protein LCGC14_2435540 [marine sediment metagenome]|uniref:Uncharacterized protein n=1 Tax=marine sediment metagenome TaxID=412755 RepID=A0A0F9BKR5_9ZZZZ
MYREDIGRGILRIDSDLNKQLNLSINDVIKITNQKKNRTTAALLKLHRIERHAYINKDRNTVKKYWDKKKGAGWGDKAVIE